MDNKENVSFNKILIINLGGIGDILLSIPALKALRNFYPKAEIHGLFTQKAYGLVRDLSYFDKIYLLNLEYGGIVPFGKNILNFKTLWALRKEHFDLAVNMRTIVSSKSARKTKIMFWVINPKIIAGRDTDGRGCFFNIKTPESLIGQKYEMEYSIDTMKALGVRTFDRDIKLKIDNKSVETINSILKEGGLETAHNLIGIHPGGMSSRRWPKENFVKIIEKISNVKPCFFVITGGKDEIILASEILNNSRSKVINLAGKLNFQELVALIKRCSLFISNDTGPVHIAAVLNTPLIAIFGPGDILRYDPRNISEKAVVLQKKVECAPCDKITCESMQCLEKIMPEEVVAVAEVLLTTCK